MKVWIAVVAILLLAILLFRERYANYEEALKAVGQTAGYILPRCADTDYTLTSNKDSCEKRLPNGTVDKKPPICPSGTRYKFRETEGNCEPDSPVSPSQNMTDPTCPTNYTFNRDAGACEKRNTDGSVSRMAGTCEDGSDVNDVGRCVTAPVTGTAASTTSSSVPTSSGSQTTSVPAPVQTAATTTPVSSTTSSSTGGTSGNLIGPTSGGAGAGGKNVWGPIFTGLGESVGGDGGDSTRRNQYPELLGGMGGRQTARVPGVGITSPSQPGFGLGVLPSDSSLGTNANARFLPFSRQPGDMDIIPDPYRLAKSYSTKNYAPQKDPVPFLTDFSAFFK